MEQLSTILNEINDNLKIIVNHITTKEKKEKKETSKKTTKKIKKKEKVKEKTVKKEKKQTTKKKKEVVYTKKKTYLTKYKNGILLHGNTFDYKTIIKSFGGFWNKVYKGWIVSHNCFDDIIKEIDSISYDDKIIDKQLIDENEEPFVIKYKKKIIENDLDDNILFDSDSD